MHAKKSSISLPFLEIQTGRRIRVMYPPPLISCSLEDFFMKSGDETSSGISDFTGVHRDPAGH
jgi:hypothetical protein